MGDLNTRLLIEIAHLRHLNSIGVHSDRISHCLEQIRFIRNSELGLDFEEGLAQEDEWMKENQNDYHETIKQRMDKVEKDSHQKGGLQMLALVRRDSEFAGIIGSKTSTVVDGVTVCIGDVVKVAPGSNHNECTGVVGIYTDKISVMGLGGTPLSKLPVEEIVSSHKDLTLESNLHQGYYVIKEFKQ